jgi:hypothetical protein
MVLTPLLIFLAITVVTWAIAIALYQTFVGGPDLRQHPHFYQGSAVAVGLVTLAFPIPFPGGYLVSLGLWWITAKCLLELPLPRAVALFLILASLAFVSHLAIRGALAL